MAPGLWGPPSGGQWLVSGRLGAAAGDPCSPSRQWDEVGFFGEELPSIYQYIFINLRNNFIYLFIFGCSGSLLLYRVFSSWGEQGLLSSCIMRVPQCGGFSCCRAQALGAQASVAVAHGLSSCSSWAPGTGSIVVAHRLSCSEPCGILIP